METFEVVAVLDRNFTGALTAGDQQLIREVASLGFTHVKVEGKGWVRMARLILDGQIQEQAIKEAKMQARLMREALGTGHEEEVISCRILEGQASK